MIALTGWEKRLAPKRRPRFRDVEVHAEEMIPAADACERRLQARQDAKVKFIPHRKGGRK